MPKVQHHALQECFKEHPEYYAEVKGQEVGEHGELCLTNPDVRRISIERRLNGGLESNPR